MIEQSKTDKTQALNEASELKLSTEIIREPYFRIVCPPLYGGDWEDAEMRVGPGTFWTPRSDAILEMAKAVLIHYGRVSHLNDEPGLWQAQVYRLDSAVMREVDNWNTYGRACQQGERTLVEALQNVESVFSFHPAEYQGELGKLRLLMMVECLFGGKIEEYIDYSKGEKIRLNGEEAFLFDNRKNWQIEVAVRDGSWRFKVIQSICDPERFNSFLESKGVQLSEGFDPDGRFDWFFLDKQEDDDRRAARLKEVAENRVPPRQRRSRLYYESRQNLDEGDQK